MGGVARCATTTAIYGRRGLDAESGDRRRRAARNSFAPSTPRRRCRRSWARGPRMAGSSTPRKTKRTPAPSSCRIGSGRECSAADPNVIGTVTRVTLPGSTASPQSRRTIVGVLPETFSFPGDEPDILIPIGSTNTTAVLRRITSLRAIGTSEDGRVGQRRSVGVEPLVRRDESPDKRTSRVVTLTARPYRPWRSAAVADARRRCSVAHRRLLERGGVAAERCAIATARNRRPSRARRHTWRNSAPAHGRSMPCSRSRRARVESCWRRGCCRRSSRSHRPVLLAIRRSGSIREWRHGPLSLPS